MIRCGCGRSVEYPPDFLLQRYRLASDTLVFDLQFRLQCQGCNRRGEFRVTIFDERSRGDSSKPRLERVVAINRSDLGRRCHKKDAFGDALDRSFLCLTTI